MPHRLVVGQTETGKTTIAKALIERSHEVGVFATVYTVIPGDWPEGCVVLHTPEEYFAVIRERINIGQRQLCVTDEADTILNLSEKQNHWLATRGRHFGIENIFCTQRPTMIAPTVREMCSELFCFRVGAQSARMLADDFGDDRIMEAVNLRQGEYLYSRWENREKRLDKFSAFD